MPRSGSPWPTTFGTILRPWQGAGIIRRQGWRRAERAFRQGGRAVKIKISADVEISALKQLEAQLQRQTVQAKALGKPFKELEKQLGDVQGRLAEFGRGEKISSAFKEIGESIPVVGTAMKALNGSFATVAGGIAAVKEA